MFIYIKCSLIASFRDEKLQPVDLRRNKRQNKLTVPLPLCVKKDEFQCQLYFFFYIFAIIWSFLITVYHAVITNKYPDKDINDL